MISIAKKMPTSSLNLKIAIMAEGRERSERMHFPKMDNLKVVKEFLRNITSPEEKLIKNFLLLFPTDLFKRMHILDTIHEAARSGKLGEVQHLIESDPSLVFYKKELKSLCSPLHFAALYGHLEVCPCTLPSYFPDIYPVIPLPFNLYMSTYLFISYAFLSEKLSIHQS